MQATHVSKALTRTLEHQTKERGISTPMSPLAESLLEKFQTFQEPDLEHMRGEALRFCMDLQARKEPRWLTITGPSGTGKTTLARLIKQFVMQKGRYYRICAPGGDVMQQHPCFFASWPAVVDQMKTGDFSTVDSLCEKYSGHEAPESRRGKCVVWFAVIDDIGQAQDTTKPYLLAALGRIADARLGAWTVWTSNLHCKEIGDRLDVRIASRMIRGGNVVVENNAVDFNIR